MFVESSGTSPGTAKYQCSSTIVFSPIGMVPPHCLCILLVPSALRFADCSQSCCQLLSVPSGTELDFLFPQHFVGHPAHLRSIGMCRILFPTCLNYRSTPRSVHRVCSGQSLFGSVGPCSAVCGFWYGFLVAPWLFSILDGGEYGKHCC